MHRFRWSIVCALAWRDGLACVGLGVEWVGANVGARHRGPARVLQLGLSQRHTGRSGGFNVGAATACGPARVLQLGLFPKSHWQVWQVSGHSHIAPATVCADSVRWGTISNIMHVVWWQCDLQVCMVACAGVWFDGCRCIAGQSVRAGQCGSLGQCHDASVADQSRYLSCIAANMSENTQHTIAPKNQGDSVSPACGKLDTLKPKCVV